MRWRQRRPTTTTAKCLALSLSCIVCVCVCKILDVAAGCHRKRERERAAFSSFFFPPRLSRSSIKNYKEKRRVGSRLGYFRLPPLQFSLNVGDIKKMTATDNDLLRGGRPTIPRFMRHMVISLIKQKWRNHRQKERAKTKSSASPLFPPFLIYDALERQPCTSAEF